MDHPLAHYTVLRIKRKATQPPLESLLIEESERATKTAKNSRDASATTARGIFRLAETVRGSWEGYGKEADDLKYRIHQLMNQPSVSSVSSASSIPTPTPLPTLPTSTRQTTSKRYRVVKPQPRSKSHPTWGGEGSGSSRPSSPYERFGAGVAGRLGLSRNGSGSGKRRLDDGPPVVRDTSLPEIPQADLKFIDAQEIYTPTPSGPPTPSQSSRNSLVVKPIEGGAGGGGGAAGGGGLKDEEDEDDRYLPLLAEAMRLSNDQLDIQNQTSRSTTTPPLKRDNPIPISQQPYQPYSAIPPSIPHQPYSAIPPSIQSTPLTGPSKIITDDDDFVYDLYYRDLDGGKDDIQGNAVGALAGYEELFEDDLDTSEEEGDEADEDSNEEDFYRNDYPEDEDADSDGSIADEPDRDTYIQAMPQRRGYKYGDEMDDNRDGFESDDDRPLAMKSFNEVFGIDNGRGRTGDGDEDEEDEEEMGMVYGGGEDEEVIGEVEQWKVL